MPTRCPCGSMQAYANCCQPLHAGMKAATTAEQLMRSRYAAFVLQLPDYIVATTASFEQAGLDKQQIADWAQQTAWDGLEVISHRAKLGKHHAQVEFNAYFVAEGQRHAHHECATFVKILHQPEHAARWYFLDPTVSPTLLLTFSQKQPCPCGSGEKYKRCCGKFLP